MNEEQNWHPVYDFWFPASLDDASLDVHRHMIEWWFGGESNAALPRFAPLLVAAQSGRLDHWRADPQGRLSLILVLDQFRRGLLAGTPAAYATDPECLQITEEGLCNGHYQALTRPWEKTFFLLPLGHVEGPGHIERMRRFLTLAQTIEQEAPARLKPLFQFSISRLREHLDVIARFGRFPHRNPILGRQSTPAEAAYLQEEHSADLPRPPG
jgi:uncharacterized protein (DUF924 family)